MPTLTRREALARDFRDESDTYLVTSLVNVRWLTGFTGSHGAVLVAADGAATLATDGRYLTQAAAECPDVEVIGTRTVAVDLVAHAAVTGCRRIAIERHALTLAAYDVLLTAADGSVDLVDGHERVEQLRVVKDDDELAALRAACRVTDETFTAVLADLRPGITEADVEWLLRAAMHSRGAAPAFDSIVAAGDNAARPHHRPTERPLQSGDLLTMDFGARVDGYHADMTRTVVIGRAAQWQRDLHALVLDIQQEASAAVTVGAVPADLDAAARGRIEAAGHDAAHGLGHGVGLQIHEAPFLVPGSAAARLVERVPVTVEPGIYLPGRGGVRIEDTVVVRTGGAEALTTSPRHLIEI